jgi:hypothetical protein
MKTWGVEVVASGQFHAQSTLPPKGNNPQYPLDRKLGGSLGLDSMEKLKFLTLPGLELWPLARPVCSHYRDCATMAFQYNGSSVKYTANFWC